MECRYGLVSHLGDAPQGPYIAYLGVGLGTGAIELWDSKYGPASPYHASHCGYTWTTYITCPVCSHLDTPRERPTTTMGVSLDISQPQKVIQARCAALMESRWRTPGQWQKRQCGMAVVETLADFKRYAEVDETKSHCSYRVAHIFVSTGTFVTHPRTLDGLLPVHLQPLLTSGGGTSGAIIWLIRIANRNGGAGAGPVSRRRFLR